MHDRIYFDEQSHPDRGVRVPPTAKLRALLAILFSLLFIVLSLSLGALSVQKFIGAFNDADGMISGIVYAINMAVISLATFELGLSVGKEYTQDDSDNIYAAVRRSITRFVGVVCIALVLEGLIMVIKYSQLELAGNLGYPVAIVASAAFLLIALGVFLFLTRDALVEGIQVPGGQGAAGCPCVAAGG